MNRARPGVLYVAGLGRCGSTLLESLCVREFEAVGIGEVRYLWFRGAVEDHRCSCGKRFSDCAFWQEVMRRCSLRIGHSVDAAHVIALARSVDRVRFIPMILFSALRTPRFRRSWAEYSEYIGALYYAIAETGGRPLIIDSSKDPSYAAVLARLRRDGAIDLRVVHMVRDPRATAWSWMRRRSRPEIVTHDELMPTFSVSASSFEWLMRNALLSALARGLGWSRLRYEEFASDPVTEVERVRLLVSDISRTRTGTDWKPDMHSVSGNPMRFSELQAVQLDDEWLNKMSGTDRFIATVFALPLLRLYRYPLIGRRTRPHVR